MILGSIFVLQHELKSRTLKVGPSLAFRLLNVRELIFLFSSRVPSFHGLLIYLVVNNIILKT